MNAPDPDVEQGWVDLADQIVRRARDAAKNADKNAIKTSIDECSEFVSIRTLACPKAVVEAVNGVQVELSQMLVADDIDSVKGRTKQFDAYLQDIDALSDQAERAADLISFKSASDIVDNLTDIVTAAKGLKKSVNNGDVNAILAGLDQIVAQLQKVQNDFDALSS